jgi:hypothetical protein
LNFEYIKNEDTEDSDTTAEFRSSDTAIGLLYNIASKKFELRKAGIEGIRRE